MLAVYSPHLVVFIKFTTEFLEFYLVVYFGEEEAQQKVLFHWTIIMGRKKGLVSTSIMILKIENLCYECYTWDGEMKFLLT
jgi:hypothetical protein